MRTRPGKLKAAQELENGRLKSLEPGFIQDSRVYCCNSKVIWDVTLPIYQICKMDDGIFYVYLRLSVFMFCFQKLYYFAAVMLTKMRHGQLLKILHLKS